MLKEYRTDSYNKALKLIYDQTNELRGMEKEKRTLVVRILSSVPRPGIEPGWIAPLVFETSASTDSAIWAFARAKVITFSFMCKYLGLNCRI